jgi:hypothetical protein
MVPRPRIPVHLLTKSALVERDFDLLAAISAEKRAVLRFSIALTDERHREVFEPGAAPLAERWRLLAVARGLGIRTGVMAMPLLPALSDSPASVAALVAQAAATGVDFMCCGGLTLRPGVQRDGLLAGLERHFSDLVPGYHKLFAAGGDAGAGDPRYLARLDQRCRAAPAEGRMPGRMPQAIFRGLVPTYTEPAVLIEHRGFERGEPGGGRGALAQAGGRCPSGPGAAWPTKAASTRSGRWKPSSTS